MFTLRSSGCAAVLCCAAIGCPGENEPLSEVGALAPARPRAPAAGSACELNPEGIRTIERPMFPGDPRSPTFGYSFKVYPGTDPTAPTVIFLPGGPGEPSISDERREVVPETYTFIQTDPRGVGCNAPEHVDDYPSAFYDSVWLADDVLAIVKELGIDKYILYGISYGTMLATLTASKAESRGMAPRALVLEGVLGEAFPRNGQAQEGFVTEWRTLRDRLPVEIREQLSREPLPLGLSALQWGKALEGLLPVGTVAPPLSYLEQQLAVLGPDGTDAEREGLRQLVLDANEPEIDDFGWRLHTELSCHEITETNFLNLALENGELEVVETYCDDQPLDRPYTAQDWPVTSPIYYFVGTNDPNTPPSQAVAHYTAEPKAPRQLVAVAAAGHNALSFNLPDCWPALWQAMAKGDGLLPALGTCGWPTAIVNPETGESTEP